MITIILIHILIHVYLFNHWGRQGDKSNTFPRNRIKNRKTRRRLLFLMDKMEYPLVQTKKETTTP